MFLDKNSNEFGKDILVGLDRTIQKSTPSKYLYDDLGSELFEKITQQPEYYPTRTEIEILEKYSFEIIKDIQKEIVLVELGSGSSKKTKFLFDKILKRQTKLYYFPIDISFDYLNSIVSNLENSLSNVVVKGIPSEYIEGIRQCNNILFENDIEKKNISRLLVFLGSSIGNFEIDEARNFLKDIRLHITNDDLLLVGFDLVKERSIIESAYNDVQGITSKFNLNLLNRINKELNANFNIENFTHKAYYDQNKKRIEMHILSNSDQQVYIPALDKNIHFKKDETIHTENSYKYDHDRLSELINRAGFSIYKEFFDKNNWYELVLLKPS
ncbi:MAG TPA: L-histidine N(alpha)-methyltransferase [Candidatus Nitrosocosmicus sp.]